MGFFWNWKILEKLEALVEIRIQEWHFLCKVILLFFHVYLIYLVNGGVRLLNCLYNIWSFFGLFELKDWIFLGFVK